MSREDLTLVRGWLRTPDVRRWWGDPDEELALIEGDLDDPRMSLGIVSFAGVPFAYIQDYSPHDWAMHHFSSLPDGSRRDR
jgi:aminoglycoside 6'-N-acetyltransferase